MAANDYHILVINDTGRDVVLTAWAVDDVTGTHQTLGLLKANASVTVTMAVGGVAYVFRRVAQDPPTGYAGVPTGTTVAESELAEWGYEVALKADQFRTEWSRAAGTPDAGALPTVYANPCGPYDRCPTQTPCPTTALNVGPCPGAPPGYTPDTPPTLDP